MSRRSPSKPLHVCTTLEELNKQIDRNYNPKNASQYESSMATLMTAAEKEYSKGDEETAYLFYMRYIEMLSQRNKAFPMEKNKSKAKDDMARVLKRCEELSTSLSIRYKLLKAEEEAVALEKKAEEEAKVAVKSKAVVAVERNGSSKSSKPLREPYKNPDEDDVIEAMSVRELKSRLDRKVEEFLFIDVRTTTDFNTARIASPKVISIPSEFLSPGMTPGKIMDYLNKAKQENPNDIRLDLWNTRTTVDAIVLLDMEEQSPPLRFLFKAMVWYDVEYRDVVSPKVRVVEGGYTTIQMTYPSLLTAPFHPSQLALRGDSNGLGSDVARMSLASLEYPDTFKIAKKSEPPTRPPPETKPNVTLVNGVDKDTPEDTIDTQDSHREGALEEPLPQLHPPTPVPPELKKPLPPPLNIPRGPLEPKKPKNIPLEPKKPFNYPLKPPSSNKVNGEVTVIPSNGNISTEASTDSMKKTHSTLTVDRSTKPKASKEDSTAPESLGGGLKRRSLSYPNLHGQSMEDEADEGDIEVASSTPIFSRTLKPTPREFHAVSSTQQGNITGLKNLGNTCYMNSILQCLYHTQLFCNYFVSNQFQKELIPTSKTRGEISKILAISLREMSKGHRCISLSNFRQSFGIYNNNFRSNEQQDSHEYLTILLGLLHEELNINKVNEKKYKEILGDDEGMTSAKAFAKYQKTNQSAIFDLFCGQQRSSVVCGACRKVSTTFDAFYNLSLPIPMSSTSYRRTLQDCLDLYTAEEPVHDWACPKCRKKGAATKKITITRLPPYLIIHLQRFYNDGYWKKRLVDVEFPLDGFCPPCDDIDVRYYNLYGVSNHYGTMDGGHYTAMCRRKNNPRVWVKFDDSDSCEVSRGQVCSSAAYILFYSNIPLE